MKRLVVLIALLALMIPAAADAAGYIKAAPRRFYSSYLHLRVNYEVYDAGLTCIKDEYGLYPDYDCYDYDENNATLDIRFYRIGSKWRQFHMRRGLVYSDEMSGFHGKATGDFFYTSN